MAVDAQHNAWFGAQREIVRVAPDGTYQVFPCCSNPAGISVDSSGFIWVADYTLSAVTQLSPAGLVTNTTQKTGGLASPNGIAIDGAGTVWVTNYNGHSISGFAGSNTSSPTTPIAGDLGFGSDMGLSTPYDLAVDASGNLWVTNFGNNTLTEFVGLASPVRTPLLGPSVTP